MKRFNGKAVRFVRKPSKRKENAIHIAFNWNTRDRYISPLCINVDWMLDEDTYEVFDFDVETITDPEIKLWDIPKPPGVCQTCWDAHKSSLMQKEEKAVDECKDTAMAKPKAQPTRKKPKKTDRESNKLGKKTLFDYRNDLAIDLTLEYGEIIAKTQQAFECVKRDVPSVQDLPGVVKNLLVANKGGKDQLLESNFQLTKQVKKLTHDLGTLSDDSKRVWGVLKAQKEIIR